MFLMRHELRFYIPEDDIFHTHRLETLKSSEVVSSRLIFMQTTVQVYQIIILQFVQ
jgi:hypothetical protein